MPSASPATCCRDLNIDSKRYPAAVGACRDQRSQERAGRLRRGIRRDGPDQAYERKVGRGLRRVPEAAAQGRRGDGFRRPVDRSPSRMFRNASRTCSSTWQRRFEPHPGRRVPGHQSGAERARACCWLQGRGQRVRGRRCRPVDLSRSASRRHPQHPRVRERVSPGDHGDRARAELPQLEPEHPRRRQCGDRQQRPGRKPKESLDRTGRRAS